MQAPREEHMNSACRVLHYIKGTLGCGTLLHASNTLHLSAYCDSDWGACPLTRRPLTGYLVTLGGLPISWKTKKQVTVLRSSTEAKYRSMAAVTSELVWLKSLLASLGVFHTEAMHLSCDIKLCFTSIKILCFMNVRNISNLTVTLFGNDCNQVIWTTPILLPSHNLQTFSQKHLERDNFSTYRASWALPTYMHQLEGES